MSKSAFEVWDIKKGKNIIFRSVDFANWFAEFITGIQNSRQNHSKNKLVRENERMEVALSRLIMGSC